ncbi:uncharacterized protein CMC5_008540 [Chondromyces crocatus]|uniref:Uncharacterized protein n=1 Tax=Chondromyces crocatus TaxID=52 RepID=A0A0K1E838_CHOCO|nr:uncharacterized protein CMC5_008540 [Chondromyces crocatus]
MGLVRGQELSPDPARLRSACAPGSAHAVDAPGDHAMGTPRDHATCAPRDHAIDAGAIDAGVIDAGVPPDGLTGRGPSAHGFTGDVGAGLVVAVALGWP